MEDKSMRMKTSSAEGARPGIRLAGKTYSLATPNSASSGHKRALPKGSDCTKIAAVRRATR